MCALKKNLRKFLRDRTGSATIEFVIWLPLLTLWLVFSTTIFIAYDSRNAAAKAAYTISDILSRVETLNAATMNQVMALNNRLIQGAPGGALTRVTSIKRVVPAQPSDPSYEIRWSCGYGGLEALVPEHLPFEIMPTMQPLDTLLLTEFYVPFVPISSLGGIRPFNWTQVLITQPRFTIEIGQPTGGCGNGGQLYTAP